mgnify:CR=1 FL=1
MLISRNIMRRMSLRNFQKVAELPDMTKVEKEYRLMVEAEMAAKFEIWRKILQKRALPSMSLYENSPEATA